MHLGNKIAIKQEKQNLSDERMAELLVITEDISNDILSLDYLFYDDLKAFFDRLDIPTQHFLYYDYLKYQGFRMK